MQRAGPAQRGAPDALHGYRASVGRRGVGDYACRWRPGSLMTADDRSRGAQDERSASGCPERHLDRLARPSPLPRFALALA